ncbi:MAG: helix-turn-helix transcriptional regulator [Agathobacter sp.]|nr:helix-turn-helix transcriptional regulator [Agathobacter sp.]
MFFKRIGDLRQDNDLTQQQVADLLHCQREVYRRYEKGTREIPVSYAIFLADYYKVSVDYLLGVSDKKN